MPTKRNKVDENKNSSTNYKCLGNIIEKLLGDEVWGRGSKMKT